MLVTYKTNNIISDHLVGASFHFFRCCHCLWFQSSSLSKVDLIGQLHGTLIKRPRHSQLCSKDSFGKWPERIQSDLEQSGQHRATQAIRCMGYIRRATLAPTRCVITFVFLLNIHAPRHKSRNLDNRIANNNLAAPLDPGCLWPREEMILNQTSCWGKPSRFWCYYCFCFCNFFLHRQLDWTIAWHLHQATTPYPSFASKIRLKSSLGGYNQT